MGGCASKPKESDFPVQAPASPEEPQFETVAQDNTSGGESQIEKSLVDLSEPEKEAQGSSSEPQAFGAEPVSSDSVAETVKPTADDVKAATKHAEDKVEVTHKTTVVPAKEAVTEKTSAAPEQ